MDEEDRLRKKIYLPSLKTGKLIEYTEEDLKPYRDCAIEKVKVPYLISTVASVAAALLVPLRNKPNVFFHRLGVGCLCFFSMKIYSDLSAASACYPVLQRIESEVEKRTMNEERTDNTTSDSYAEKVPEISPLDYSSLDLNPPGTFSIDFPREQSKIDNDAEPRYTTYEELRKRNRESHSYKRYAGNTRIYDEPNTINDGNMLGTDLSSSLQKTNIYGDILE